MALDEHADNTAEKMHDNIMEFFTANDEGLVVKWMLQAEVMDNNGDTALWTLAAPDMAVWDKLGFVEYLKVHYTGAIQQSRDE